MEGRIHRTRPSRSTFAEETEKDKIDPPIHTGYFHTGEANTLNFIVDGSNVVNSFVCAQKSLKTMSCHLTTRHGVQILAEINVAIRDV